VVLIVGLASAVIVNMTAANEPGDVVSYRIVAGQVFATTANDSKQYRHDLERFGGKAAILADDFNRWFAGLWKGKRLAYTLLVLSTGCALVCFWGAHRFTAEKAD
jgi:hypothetical protein